MFEGLVVWECGKVKLAQVTNQDQAHQSGNPQLLLNKGKGNSNQPVEVPVLDRIELPVNPVNPDNLNIVEC